MPWAPDERGPRVLMRPAEVEAVRAGTLDLAFRRWDRPRLRPGTRMRTLVGLIEVVAVEQVAGDDLTDEDARRAGAASRDELLARLADRPDRPVYRVGLRYAGPDPRDALREDDDLSDEVRAELLGHDPVVFEREVRRLEELGRTESLSVGYRLSPRGRALLPGLQQVT